jgi:2-keto-4-pentenoate hydratase/2-oxohepta-3-ene-1,7-dioic acid hydratase in catechol pathway
MKLAKYSDSSGEHWGSVDLEAETIRPISGGFEDWAPAVTAEGPGVLSFDGEAVPLGSVKLLAPRPVGGEVVWVALNYPDWPKPDDADPPVFLKPRSAIIGPGDTFRYPALIKKQTQCYFCYETEMVAVIGAPEVDNPARGTKDVLGYTIGIGGALRNVRVGAVGIDLVALRSGKSTSSLGPWIVTKDEFAPGSPDLDFTTRVNGELAQSGNTGDMLWDMDKLIFEVGHRLRLSCGDVIYTGTAGYIGAPDGFFHPGDRIEATIDGIGTLANTMEDDDPYAVHPSQRLGGEKRAPNVYPTPLWRRS